MALPLLLALVVASQNPAGDACSFFIAVKPAPVEIVGAPDAVRRMSVARQPDSPLRIVRVDLPAPAAGGDAGALVRFDVVNASNRTIRGGSVGFTWRVGYVSSSGSAPMTDSLGPGAGIRFDARLPVDKVSGPSAEFVAISVRSVSFDGCRFEPAQMAVTVPRTSVSIPQGAEDACAFTVSIDDERPKVTGPPDVLARLTIVPQAGSPLRIRSLDLSHLRLNIGESWLQVRGRYTIEVQNVSDHSIENAIVALSARARGPAGADRPAWRGTLAPGKKLTLRQEVARIADLPPDATRDDVQLLAGIERILFGRCAYRPGRVYPEPRQPRD